MTNLTPQEKKNYLLAKYTKRDYKVEELSPKYAVYFNPSIEKTKEWSLICVCSTNDEAKAEILWRTKFHETGDGDLILDNDVRFKTFRDETKNVDPRGVTYEPGQELMTINYDTPGNALQVIANAGDSIQKSGSGFKGLCHYTQFDFNEYKGFYKIVEIYEVC